MPGDAHWLPPLLMTLGALVAVGPWAGILISVGEGAGFLLLVFMVREAGT